LEFITVDHWDDEIWNIWCPIYEEAFGGKNGKRKHIIRSMFRKFQCYFHLVRDYTGVIAIALTGKLRELPVLLIDYLAVDKKRREKGIGRTLVRYIKNWAIESGQFDGIVIEVEAGHSIENQKRSLFWQMSGFIKTDYIHHYKVVPEPYRAMYVKLKPNANIPKLGEEWFRHIGYFHRKSFQKES